MLFYPIALVVLAIATIVTKLSFNQALSTRQRLWLLVFCIAYGAFPLLLAWAGFGLADYFDCQVSTITYQCADEPWIGSLISYMVFAHWFAILTIPFALFNIVAIAFATLASRWR